MAEYIDREAVLNILASKNAPWDGYQKVSELPAADVQPVKHGRWEEIHNWFEDIEYSCSVCGCYALYKELRNDQICSEYCPYCGALMDGDYNG